MIQEGEDPPTLKESKAYPYLKALLDGLIEAAPNWAKAPGKFVSSLSEQLQKKNQEQNKQLEKEIKSISEEELRELIKEAGYEQKEDIELIVGKVQLIPEILQTLNYRFDKVDEKLEEIKKILLREKPSLTFPFAPALNNQTPPEENFVGREEELDTITEWYKSDKVRIGALIGWGGVGKSALVRKWYDSLEANKIRPDGIFWWGFYHNAYLERFLDALLRYVSEGQVEPWEIKGTWEKVERIKENISRGAYLIILDGLEQMQEGKSGDEFGKMAHRECMELLHYLADVPKSEGLCLITTRYRLKDLEDWENRGYENRSLVDLSNEDAILMLKKRGVNGSDDDMTEVINRYKGHALSLISVAGYLNRYYSGDIKHAPKVEFVLGDKERFKDVNKLLGRYAEKMSEAERVFLNIFSLFRQEVTERDFVGVFREKIEGTGFNDVLINMSNLDFRDLVDGLVDWRLISRDEKKKLYTTHPLIKGYFESDFDKNNKKLWCHKRIYQYFGEYAPERADTIEQMQPLFEQVYHGCAAGLYDEVLNNVYWEKIYRKEEHFIKYNLGAWEIDLSLVKTFFPEDDFLQMPFVSEKSNQSWLLAMAGLALLNTGRPKEAEEPFLTGVKMDIEAKNWENASVGYQNLADLQFRTGELQSGLESAKKALEISGKAKSGFGIWASKAWLGWILFLLGKTEKAEKNFRQADKFNIKIDSYGNRLYGLWGVFYADFFTSMGRIDKAFELTIQNLEICRRNFWPGEISRCYRCLGTIERIRGIYNEAEMYFQNALEIARKVGMPELEIETLLERGRLNLDMGKYEDAIRDAKQVLQICERTGFRFYEPGEDVVLGRAYLSQNDYEEAEKFAKSAYEKAVAMKYRWAEGDAAHLLGEIELAKEDKKESQQWLKKAIKCRKEILDPKAKESEAILERL
jgi:tetratricopeptide (TPR) repeat protein